MEALKEIWLIGPVVSEKTFEECDLTEERACLDTISSYEPKGSGELTSFLGNSHSTVNFFFFFCLKREASEGKRLFNTRLLD